jgi:phosphoglucomutase
MRAGFDSDLLVLPIKAEAFRNTERELPPVFRQQPTHANIRNEKEERRNQMYQDDYKRWLNADLIDFDLKKELRDIEGDDEAIKDRFAVKLQFGTAGLRGTLGAGTNRMNIWVVRQATQGVADWVKTQGGTQTVAISYDSRLKGWNFARDAAGVLAANGIKVRIYDELMPVPALSFATRYYKCNAGIMVTASHNPAKYNGYKAYGPDGCQMTDDAAAVVYDSIQKTDVLTGAKYMSFAEGVEKGLIQFVGDDCKEALYAAIEERQVRPGLAKTAGLKLVYSPLNGTGLVPVTRVLQDIGITDITIVPEQEYPNGYFTTAPYPNPEIFEALKYGLELAKKTGADLMLATDPDADRVGIAMKCPDGSYELVSGNEMGVLLLDYICAGRIEKGTMPKNPVAVKSIVSTPLADLVAKHYGVELRHTLTGFKWIGDQIAQLEAAGEVDRFIFGFEESYGYLAGPYVRDKDAVIGSMLICEMAAYYRSIGSSIKQRLEEIYKEYGRYLNKVDSFEFPGLSGMDKMAGIMAELRKNPPADFAGRKVVSVTDYEEPEKTGLPKANVLIYGLEDGASVVVRPSGTEPKIKAYYTTKGKDLAEAEAEKEELAAALKPIFE